MGRLDGHVALISGGARGMGAAQAALFVAEGARVVIGDVRDDENAATAARLGQRCRAVPLDVTSEHDWQRAVEATEDAWGPLTVLVNNAGIVETAPIEQTSVEAFRRIVDVNLTGTFLGIKAAIPSMRQAGGGAIVNLSSTAGLAGYLGLGSYVSSKFGVRGVTRVAALELAREHIRVNSVHPAPIATPMTDHWDEHVVTGNQPIPRFGTPDEVASMVLFIVADATFSTGSEFVVDGGLTTGLLPRVTR
jgi:3alpha(or 20beta)-hydroxysteroid dehydrogenase